MNENENENENTQGPSVPKTDASLNQQAQQAQCSAVNLPHPSGAKDAEETQLGDWPHFDSLPAVGDDAWSISGAVVVVGEIAAISGSEIILRSKNGLSLIHAKSWMLFPSETAAIISQIQACADESLAKLHEGEAWEKVLEAANA